MLVPLSIKLSNSVTNKKKNETEEQEPSEMEAIMQANKKKKRHLTLSLKIEETKENIFLTCSFTNVYFFKKTSKTQLKFN